MHSIMVSSYKRPSWDSNILGMWYTSIRRPPSLSRARELCVGIKLCLLSTILQFCRTGKQKHSISFRQAITQISLMILDSAIKLNESQWIFKNIFNSCYSHMITSVSCTVAYPMVRGGEQRQQNIFITMMFQVLLRIPFFQIYHFLF